MSIVDKDKGIGMMRKLARKGPVIDVGFLGVKASATKRDRDNLPAAGQKSVAEIAFFHEYGTKTAAGKTHIPKRSMLFSWITERQRAIIDASVTIAGSLVERRITLPQGINQFGLFAVGDVQTRMQKGIAPPLKGDTRAELFGPTIGTRARTPLIDTGQMINSIGYRKSR